ncbi:MAG: 23S rRNA (adenine(2503)-C(2))-methyltransferase RlmN [Clostridia bacterium]|nr:23S rRNA (adenine(2503)-C(2))-methyltransferase RlmN [Clostridia bacterium]
MDQLSDRPEPLDLLSLSLEELRAYLVGLGQPSYRADQLYGWMYKGRAFDEMTNLPAPLIALLKEKALCTLPAVTKKLVSQIDGTVKFLFTLYDGQPIESVVMFYEHGISICISTQAGCRMGCKFCASTLNGKDRDLLPSEMLGQIIVAQREIGQRISNVVLMGIGEPLDNYDNVLKFLHLLGDEKGLCIGQRHVSLSTCGLADRIRQLSKEKLQITLSISLHAYSDEKRSELMPVNRKWNLNELLGACAEYFAATGRRISFEYTLIEGVNDQPDGAKRLALLLKRYMGDMPVHVNLIPVNPVKERGFVKSGVNAVEAFRKVLSDHGINATVRRKLGSDINASCGQLRHESKNC